MKKEKVKKGSSEFENISRINNLLSKRKAKILDKLTKLDDQGELMKLSTREIKQRLAGENNLGYVFVLWESVIAEQETAGRVGNARLYRTILKSVQKFTGGKDFPLTQLTFAWLKKFEAWYLGKTNQSGKKNSLNGLSVNLRTIRALYNRAIKQNLVSKESYPFTHYKIRKEETRKRAISFEDVMKLNQKRFGKVAPRPTFL